MLLFSVLLYLLLPPPFDWFRFSVLISFSSYPFVFILALLIPMCTSSQERFWTLHFRCLWHLGTFSVGKGQLRPLSLRSCCSAMRASSALRASFMAFFCLSLRERQISFIFCLRSSLHRWNGSLSRAGVPVQPSFSGSGASGTCALRQRGDSLLTTGRGGLCFSFKSVFWLERNQKVFSDLLHFNSCLHGSVVSDGWQNTNEFYLHDYY